MPKKFERKPKKKLSVDDYTKGILEGNRIILSQAITLIESTKTAHQEIAQQIIEQCLPHTNQSIRIGITGTPGVGKSTFIEALGNYLTDQERKLTVLAIDPSSQVSKGSILGDKTRMTNLSTNKNAFIRPSPAGNSLGGVARKTRETIILCEAAGYDTIIVETVGVGQSEIAVHSMVDFFLLLLLPGAGDELQGIKRGIVEMADLIAVNKADGDRITLAKQAKRSYKNALHLYPIKESKWTPKVLTCSALDNIGIGNIWKTIVEYQTHAKENDFFAYNRKRQAHYWLHESIQAQLKQRFYNDETIKNTLTSIEKSVNDNRISPFKAAQDLINSFLKR